MSSKAKTLLSEKQASDLALAGLSVDAVSLDPDGTEAFAGTLMDGLECPGCGQSVDGGAHDCPHDSWLEPVLGFCPHGVDLDREFCPDGCRV